MWKGVGRGEIRKTWEQGDHWEENSKDKFLREGKFEQKTKKRSTDTGQRTVCLENSKFLHVTGMRQCRYTRIHTQRKLRPKEKCLEYHAKEFELQHIKDTHLSLNLSNGRQLPSLVPLYTQGDWGPEKLKVRQCLVCRSRNKPRDLNFHRCSAFATCLVLHGWGTTCGRCTQRAAFLMVKPTCSSSGYLFRVLLLREWVPWSLSGRIRPYTTTASAAPCPITSLAYTSRCVQRTWNLDSNLDQFSCL